MARRVAARRIVAVFGVALLLAGVVLAAVLLALAPRARDGHVDDLARGVVGCRTPLEFTRTGTFYVFEEIVSGADAAPPGCAANPQPGEFRVEMREDGRALELVPDRSASYDGDGHLGTSVARFDIARPGIYELVVTGPDAATLAAVGPDPDDVASHYRRWALLGGIAGVVAGTALLVASALAADPRPGRAPVAADIWAAPDPRARRG